LDLFKNKIIADLSGLGDKNWPIGLSWGNEDDDNNRSQMIREIIKNDIKIIKRIEKYIKDNIDDEDDDKLRSQLKKEISDIIKNELNKLSDDELEEIHNKAMMDYKVMMKPDIRQITKSGEIIKSFNEFKKEN
jgi:hypothetical protein